jgi:hypothetical protein
MGQFELFTKSHGSSQTNGVSVKEAVNACQQNGSSKPSKSKKNKTDPCKFSEAKYKVDSTTLELEPNQSTPEFTAGHNKEAKILEIKLDGAEGPCSNHTKKVFDARNKFTVKENFNAELSLKSEKYNFISKGIFKPLSKARYKDYNIYANTCDFNKSQCIRIYPDVEFEFDLNINLSDNKTIEKRSTRERTKTSNKIEGIDSEKTSTGINIGGSYKQDGKTDKLSLLEFEKSLIQVKESIEVIERINASVTELIGRAVELKILYPSLSFKGYSKFEALDVYQPKHTSDKGKEKYTVQLKNKLELGLDPLIGVSLTLDLVALGLNALPGGCGVAKLIGKMNEMVKKAENKNIELTLEGKLEVIGSIFGKMFFESISHNGQLLEKNNGGELGGKIEANLKLQASAAFEIFFISIGGGIKAGIKSAAKGVAQLFYDDASQTIKSRFQVDFEGMKAYMLVYMQVSGFKTKNSDVSDDVVDPKAKNISNDEIKLGAGEKELYNNTISLMDESKWLEPKTFDLWQK